MNHFEPGKRYFYSKYFLSSSPRSFQRLILSRIVFPLLLSLLLFSGVLNNSTLILSQAHAAARPLIPARATTTLGKFLAQKAPSLQPFTYPKEQPVSPWATELQKNTPKVLPSSEPVHMAPLHQALSPTFLGTSPTATTSPLLVHGSDGKLTVSIPTGAFDTSQATLTNQAPTANHHLVANAIQTQGLQVTITQLSGASTGNIDSLGYYQFQFHDAQGHLLSGIRVRHPLTLQFHYTQQDLAGLGLDPGNLFLTWPEQINQAIAAKQSTSGLSTLMSNNAATQTLTAQTLVVGTIASVGTGAPSNQAPPKPLLATVQPNTGQLSYAYPITVAPGPNGTTPTVQLVYSSQSTNQRYEPTSPADSPGEGWGISMGSISMTNYPAGSAKSGTWYFLSGVDNVSDRLIPTTTGSTTYYTEHISRLKVQQVTPSGATQPCFHVWDTSGTSYEYGCTSDSLQYSTNTSGTRTNYRWDLDRIVPANEGPSTSTRFIAVSYLQEFVSATGGTTVRDAVIKQITYGTGTSGTALSGTVDFLYKGVTAYGSNGIQWVTAYGSNEGGCAPPSGQPATTIRCDNPVNRTNGANAPTVMSTYSLQTIKTYVGSDTSTPLQPVYSYSLAFNDNAYHGCTDSRTGLSMWCAGRHLLTSMTPTVYQSNGGHQLPGVTFSYSGEHNDYYDSTQTISSANYGNHNYWYYLSGYHDQSDGTGETITYQTALNNTHGTPNSGTDNRFNPTYCFTHTTCTGSFANPGDKAWTVQIVHTVTTLGTDSSSASLQPATTTYAYGMPTWSGTCPADSTGLTTCTGYGWYPSGEGDWLDYYHGEFHGFSWVYITSPAGDLTVENYASTEGWGTAEGFSGNYTSGQLYEQDVYSGSTADATKLISKMRNTYAGNNSTLASCATDSSYNAYEPCEVALVSSRTTTYAQTGSSNANAPWVQQDNTYDDYTSSSGFGSYPQSPATGAYHNLQQQVITSSNAPTVTKKWTYDTTDTTVGGQVYYTVHQVAHSEVDDASGHVWSCQDTTYDQGVASGIPQPAAGWPTTTTSYSNCGNHSAGATLTSDAGYNGNGQAVAAVDALGVSTPSLYSSSGCTLTTAPTYSNSAWTGGHYSGCTVYDAQSGMPTTQTNAFGQTTTTTYDSTQGQIPKRVVDVNGQTTTMNYSYDSSGNRTAQVVAPGETGSYTSQSQIVSTCTTSSILPCVQEDSNSLQYSSAISRTFYDQQGRAVETQTPSADGTQTIVAFTLYNDAARTIFSSQPFTIASQSTWVDPNSYSSTPGTLTTLDAVGRTVSVLDAIGNTSHLAYGLGSVSGDSHTYATTTRTDANGHVAVSFTDGLGRTLYTQTESGKAGGTLTPIRQTTTQYTVLNQPTSVTVTDLAPQTGQTITSVVTTAQYDDLGRETSITDPDRGTHTYSYDADGNMIGDVSGTRTLGYSHDLLGRVGCVQDAIPTLDVHGACSSGANPFVKNTYDADPSGVTWSGTNYAVGALTQSIATTYYPGPDYAQGTATENWQHDQRGRLITSRLNVAVTGGSLAFPTFPQYQETQTYNDANQAMMTQTTVGGSNGYTFSQAYNATTGTLTGLSNTSTGVANLATLGYNAQGQVGNINYLTTAGTALARSALSYDGKLRPTGMTATWQGGSSLYSQSVAYDAVGNVVSQATTQSAIPGQSVTGGSETQNFCYDEQNRLVWASNNATVPSAGNGTCGSASYQSTLGGNYTSQYVYTNLGQLWQGPLNGGTTQEQYLYCDSAHPHQLSNLSQTASSPTCASKGTVDYSGSYDTSGNVTTQVRGGITRTPVYDGQDHLVRWSSSVNSQEEWYLYDASGERVLRRSYDGTNTTITVYAFGEEEHQYSYSGSGSSALNTSNTYYYDLGGRLLGTWDGTSATTTFLLADTLGSVVSSFNNLASGAQVLGDQVYGPYGNQRTQQGTIGTSKGFTGQYNDWLTGLDYYGSRYYDPAIGQFLSADVVQGNVQGLDPYSYVGDNPETNTDPTGQRFISGDDPGTSATGVITPTHTVSVTPDRGSPAIWWGWFLWPIFTPTWSFHAPKPPSQVKAAAHAVNNTGSVHKKSDTGPDSSMGSCGLEQATCGDNTAWTQSQMGPWTLISSASIRPSEVYPDNAPDDTWTGGGGSGKDDKGDSGSSTSCGGGLSFTFTTVVATQQGEQAIGTLKVGEKVWAYNPSTKTMEVQPILHVWINHDNDLVDLTITQTTKQGKETRASSEVIHTNKKHPFLTVEKGFLPVAKINLGMHVVEADGQVGVITGWKVVPGVKVMYNLEVAQDHTFTVGVGMWVVHNCGVTGTPDPANKIAGQPDLYNGQQYNPQDLLDQGYNVVPNKGRGGTNTAYPNSTNFFAYLRSQGKSTSGWYYRMETWTRQTKDGIETITNHYWTDGVGNFFHHHP